MTHIDRVGDRFQHTEGDIVEIVKINRYTLWKVLHCPEGSWWKKGQIHSSPRDEGWGDLGWTYLGNFGKSKGFNSLYDKLNESTD